MADDKRSLLIGGLGALLLCAAVGARAQDSTGETIIGPPQLKDFQLQPRDRIVTQPSVTDPPAQEPARVQPVELSPPPPAAAPQTRAAPAPQAETPAPTVAASPVQPPRREAVGEASAASAPASAGRAEADALPSAPFTVPSQPAIAAAPSGDPAPAESLPPAPVAQEGQGVSYWLFALPAAMLALLGVAVVRRRRRNVAPALLAPAPAPAVPPPAPRPDPVPRPWLELSLKAERAAFTAAEAEIAFELEIGNKGGSEARNLRIDVKIFNAGAEQDKEIGAFFRTAGRETTKLKLPGVAAGITGVIRGTVAMPRDEIRAMRLDERLLFIPVIAVNVLYDWGEGRTGQTSRSYVVGRELQQPSEKMGAFRVDQGPRIWRSVGQRPHKLAKRV